MIKDYDPDKVETAAQSWWRDRQRFAVDEDTTKEKYYALAMFPYPSGKLHIGHARVYTITDLLARFYRMMGRQVLHPIGWDAFGLPAENAAIEQGIHPAEWTYSNIAHMRKQLQRLGLSYDWRREFATCDPSYYKWEQWLFIKMFKRGLAYRTESWVNWDPADNTVLANEQVENGRGWRSGVPVERKKLTQWNLKVTEYAEELLDDLVHLRQNAKWPEKVIVQQINWIGKSHGVQIDFPLVGSEDSVQVFTTRPDTIMGATCIAIAADHPLMDELSTHNQQLAVFAASCRVPRTPDQELKKDGMPTGLEVTHPLNGKILQVWAANFVLMEYGTGAIMSVPAHDQRDWEFATAFGIPIVQVIAPRDDLDKSCDISAGAWSGKGVCINSGKYDGMDFATASKAITADLAAKKLGEHKTTWRLRDWVVSRQRYWGAPIPIIHCPDCGEVPVPLEDLPVELPQDVTLDGRGSPLARHSAFVAVNCPECGKAARRDTDTFDTFFESSWYQSRFASHDCDQSMLDARAHYWCPVDQYVGGIEHAVLHLLYARFFHKVMRDELRDAQGNPVLVGKEPFSSLLAQGMVLAPVYQCQEDGRTIYANEKQLQLGEDQSGRFGVDTATGKRFTFAGVGKMSKSKRNGVDPEQVIAQYGADTVRLYLLFTAPPEQSLEWSERGVIGMHRYLHRLWSLVHAYAKPSAATVPAMSAMSPQQREIWRKAHQVIGKVNIDIARRKMFNTAIAAIMELTNMLARFTAQSAANATDYALGRKVSIYLIQLLAPFTPHICHSLWQDIGYQDDLLDQPYPQSDTEAAVEEMTTIVVQVNGKVRAKLDMSVHATKAQLQQAALQNQQVERLLEGKTPARVIVVPGKLVNLVVQS